MVTINDVLSCNSQSVLKLLLSYILIEIFYIHKHQNNQLNSYGKKMVLQFLLRVNHKLGILILSFYFIFLNVSIS